MSNGRMKRADVSIINWMNCIWLADLPPNAKYLACYLRKFMNDYHDMAWPSYSRIIYETGLARSSVAKYLSVLECSGWIKRDKTIGKSTTYLAVLPKNIEMELESLSNTASELVRHANQSGADTSTPRELGSTSRELVLVRHANTNKQLNKQSINNNNAAGCDGDVDDKKRTTKQVYDKQRIISTWNEKAKQHGLPTMRTITKTVDDGLKRLYKSHLRMCEQMKRAPKDMDTVINGYIKFGYEPTEWAKGANPAGKRFGIATALRQERIDEILEAAVAEA